jgi:uncharacterized RDD family membrane protein YckC
MNEPEVQYAGFWLRVAASIIDSVLLLAITLPLLVSIYGWEYFDGTQAAFVAGTADFLITWIIPAVAVIVFWAYKSATPGKMMLSARIVDATTGQPPSVAQSIGRYFAYYISLLPLGLGFLWVAFDKRKQGWHDKLASTVVIRTKARQR